MYTYKLGGISITDELYHDDLEAMTFGRKDQNELRHSGIKGMSWGKRRFQNEDGSLTAAGRNRYGVGDPLKGVSAYSDTGGRGGSGVSYFRTTGNGSSGGRTSTAQPGKKFTPVVPKPQTKSDTRTVPKSITDRANSGKKAADNLFSRIGNWATNAANDVGKAATSAYNDASKAVGNAANAAGSWVGNAVKDVGNLLSNEDEKKAAENAQNRANQALNNAINRSGEYVPDGRGGEDLYIRDANDAKMVDTAEQQAAKAQQRYDDHPVTQVQNAAKSAGNWIGNAFNDAKNWVGNAGRDVGNFATNVYNDASKAVGNAANDVGNFVNDNYNRAREAVNGVAGDIGDAATSAFNDAKNWAGNAAKDVGNFVKNAPQNISDWYTGDKNAREAQRYDNVVQNFERNGERNINEGVNTISRGINAPDSAYDIETGEKWGHKLIGEGVKQRNLGYDQHDIAREYGRKADEAQDRYENAPRQLLERAGNWVGDRVSDAGNALRPGFDAVGNAVRDAGNWVGDRANDVGNAVGDAYDSVRDTVNDAATGVRDWYTGEGDKRSADWYRDLSTRDTNFLGTGQNLIENHQAVANESRAMADALRKSGDYEGAKKYEQNAKAYQRAVDQMTSDRNRNLSNADMYDERYNNAPRQVLSNLPGNISNAAKDVGNTLGNAANSAGNAIGNAARDVGDWASNAASDVRDWGAGALDKGRQAFESLFGRSEAANNTIPEQRIEEQRIPEQRVEEQKIYDQWINDYKSRMASKPDNVSDEYWNAYTSNGGTRESYDRAINSRMYNRNTTSSLPINGTSYGAESSRVDPNRPYHFTYDPASGQTIVVYDDEKRR